MLSPNSTISIPLTKGKCAIVDTIDGDLIDLKWHSHTAGYGARWSSTKGGKKATLILLHRTILSRKLGRELNPHERCDHIDGNPLNNRRNNLRLATPRENSRNKKVDIRNTSGYTGVCFDTNRGKWRADIKLSTQRKFLGHFQTKEEAIKARQEAEKFYYGEFVRERD